MKRVFCLLLATIMTLSVGAVNVSAAEARHKRDGRGEWRQEDYERVNHTLNYLGYDEDDTVYYTEFQETVKEEDKVKYVSFIYDDERAIGQYIREKDGDETNECFIINKESELLNDMVTHFEGSKFEISEEDVMGAPAIDGAENEGWEPIKVNLANYLTNFAATGNFIKTGLVKNVESYYGKGLCWAACGASVSNYYRGTSYDAEDVLEITQIASGVEKLDGTAATVKCMYGKLGIFYTYKEGRLDYAQALKTLNNGKLIMYGIGGPYLEGHAVILCGVFRISSTYGYIYMDPNISDGYVLNYNDESAATTTKGDFYYCAGYGRYTTVFCTFYNLEKHYTIK